MVEPEQKSRESAALAYLAEQLGPRAPSKLTFVSTFAETPLDGEGAVSLFSFSLTPEPGAAACGSPPPDGLHYVVAGETVANYFPAYGLDADDAYSLHIGTRFLLEMRIGRIDPDQESPGFRDAMHGAIRETLAGVEIEHESLAGLFRGDEQTYAVYRLTLKGEDVYFMGGDCPPGFYRLAQWPPQVALRLHLGKLIRAERAEA